MPCILHGAAKKIRNTISSQVSGRAQLPGVIIYIVDQESNTYKSGGRHLVFFVSVYPACSKCHIDEEIIHYLSVVEFSINLNQVLLLSHFELFFILWISGFLRLILQGVVRLRWKQEIPDYKFYQIFHLFLRRKIWDYNFCEMFHLFVSRNLAFLERKGVYSQLILFPDNHAAGSHL